MGIIAAIKDVKAVADAIKSVKEALEALNPDRAVVLEVQNFTSLPLRLVSHDHTHGGFTETPSIEIPPDSVDIFGSKDTSVTSGTNGKVTYESDDGYLLRAEWNNPVAGTPSCNATVLGTNSGNFEAFELSGVGETANMQFSVKPGTTARPIVRKASNAAGTVKDIAVSNLGTNGITTAIRTSDNSLKLINWQVSNDGLSIRRTADSGNQAGEASDIDVAQGRLLVTACRASNGKLLLISWENSIGQIQRRGDSRNASGGDLAGEARFINIVSLTNDLFVTALQSVSGRLLLITWRLEANGELSRLADSSNQAGDVREVSLVRIVPDSQGNHRVVTAVRSGDGTLLLISWAISTDGRSVTRLSFSHGQAGNADMIRATTTDSGLIITAARANLVGTNPQVGKLLLISWSIDQHGAFTRLTDTHGQSGNINSNALMSRSSSVISAVGSQHGLKLIKWNVTPQGALRRVADSGEQAGTASIVTLSPRSLVSSAPICTAIRNGTGNLMLICWADE